MYSTTFQRRHLVAVLFIAVGCYVQYSYCQTNSAKVCRGTNYGISHRQQEIRQRYETYKQMYTNCTYIDGNLELVYLEDHTLDMSFLSQIREITGYVLIVTVYAESIPLTNLRIIRGWTQYRHKDNRSLSLAIISNYNPNRDVGLRELQLPSLHEIVSGEVLFLDNRYLCYAQTIEWSDILPATSRFDLDNSTGLNCQSECDEKCAIGEKLHCWGAGPAMCQTFTKIQCASQCDGRCFGPSPNQCCHQQCAAGCTGQTNDKCLACRTFENDGQCVQQCPPELIYSEKEFRNVPNPNARFSYGTLCVKKCPPHLLMDRGACVHICGEKRMIGTGDDSSKCVDCEGACPKQCEGTGDGYISAANIRNFTGCTVIQGNLRILQTSFDGDSFNNIPPMTVKDLSSLATVTEVTDFVQIELHAESFVSLSFLKNLRIIRGLKTNARRYVLHIYQTSLKSLDLISLKQIYGGGVFISNNRQLCYANVTWRNLTVEAFQTITIANNGNQTLCQQQGEVCSAECTSLGCWGKNDDQCLSCQHFNLEGRCLSNCDARKGIYLSGPNTCARCDPECLLSCTGPGPENCTKCKHVQDGPYCVPSCPAPKYPDERNVCQHCHEYCGSNGCSGPSIGVGHGACNACEIAVYAGDRTTITTCLSPNATCEPGYYMLKLNHQYGQQEGKSGCMPCHELCETCEGDGLSYCLTCKYYLQDAKCVQSCSPEYYLDDTRRKCLHCDDRCLTCYGRGNHRCNSCKQYTVYESYGIPENNMDERFNCTEKCPQEAQYALPQPRDDGTSVTLCVADDGSRKNMVIGVVVGVISGIVVISVVIIVVFYCRRQRARAESEKMKTAARILGVGNELQPLAPSGVEPDRAMLRLIKEPELVRGGMIGAGAFGAVYKGWWIPENENVKIPVAIKVLIESNNPSSAQSREILEEARIMASVNHKYCVRILAICMTARMMIVTQLMSFGCLRNYIQEHRAQIGSKILLNWCTQIARGMEYLESKGIVHRDLAARNLLVQRPEHIRITDFGLAKLLDNKDHFTSTGEKMPIKWLALECIQNRVFTHKSDVWSYGVTLWELFTYGETPYTNMPARTIPALLEKGERLPQPSMCTIDVFMLMIKCWVLDAESRPTFRELASEFEKMAKDPGRYLVIEGDEHLRLPSYNPESETRDFLRLLSCPTEDTSIRIVTGDEYLNPRTDNMSSVQESSFMHNGTTTPLISAQSPQLAAVAATNATPPVDQCNRRSRRATNFFRRSQGADGRTSQRYTSDPCKVQVASAASRPFAPSSTPKHTDASIVRQPSVVAAAAVSDISELNRFARQASVGRDRTGLITSDEDALVRQPLQGANEADEPDSIWVVNDNFTPPVNTSFKPQFSSGSPLHRTASPSTAAVTSPQVEEYLQPQLHDTQQPSYLDFTEEQNIADISDEGIESESEHLTGIVSNPEYFDDDAFEHPSKIIHSRTGNGNIVTGSPVHGNGAIMRSSLPSHRLAGNRLDSGRGTAAEYYNDEDELLTGRDRLSSRV